MMDGPRSPEWVRSSLNQCDFLESVNSVDADSRSVIMFAVRWAPFGGAPTEELMVAFGTNRWRFLQIFRHALRSRATDRGEARTAKRNLLEVVSWSWHAYPDSLGVRLEHRRATIGS